MTYYYGGMAEYVPVWATHVFPLSESLSLEEATLLDALGVAVHAVGLARPVAEESALILGSGTIGLLALQVLKTYNLGCIICTDLDQRPLNLAKRLGADLCLNATTSNLGKSVFEATGGIGARVVLDTIGSPLLSTLPIVARGGRLVRLAIHEKEESFNSLLTAGQRMVITSANFKYEEFPIAMDLLCTGKVNAGALITHRFPIERALEAFEVAANKAESGAIKVIINP